MTDIFVVGDRVAAVTSAVIVAPQHTFREQAGTPGKSHISHLNISKTLMGEDSLSDPDVVHADKKGMAESCVHDELLDSMLTTACVVELEDAALSAGGAMIT